jgi:two-component system CheB/CheR fusion protein
MGDFQQELEALVEHIHFERGFDFRGYKRSSLERRIRKRLSVVGIEDLDTYRAYLEAHPSEYVELLNTILINVTAFFRDPASWEVLRDQAIREILKNRSAKDPIRVWSVGCASGEEAYSLAMLFAEELGAQAFKRRVKIYATDLDEDALEQGRRGRFPAKEVQDIEESLLKKYFEKVGPDYVFQRDLRRAIIFGRHDIMNDAPISNIDLLVCRNVLIYLDTATQNRVLPRLHYALSDGGFLFLGKAETLLARSLLFEPLSIKDRIFRKIPRASNREVLQTAALWNRDARPGIWPPAMICCKLSSTQATWGISSSAPTTGCCLQILLLAKFSASARPNWALCSRIWKYPTGPWSSGAT